VSGLTKADFTVTDNGIAQTIDDVVTESLPIDVSLVVDATWQTLGLAPGLGPAGTRALRDSAQQVAALLDPEDRLGVTTFSASVEITRPMSPGVRGEGEDLLNNSTTWSFEERPRVVHALLLALTRPVAADRRHIVLVFSAARGSLDVPSEEPLVRSAARADALLYAVLNPPVYDLGHVPFDYYPSEKPIRDALSRAAEATGGKAFLTNDIVGAFRDVLEEFRRRYVLRYSLRGTRTSGWHNIVVTVPSCPSCAIQARRGYAGQ
jgi:VWFA-related protein